MAVIITGILSAIAIPSWLSFVNILRLNSAQNQIYLAMREAQSNAIRDKITWQASFREIVDQNGEDLMQWAIHLASINPVNASWYNLEPGVHLDDETTLQKSAGVSRVQFDYRGHVVLQPPNLVLGRMTLSIPDGSAAKRCVFVSTYLGTLRYGQDHPSPVLENGKIYFCY